MANRVGTFRCVDCGRETTRRVRSDRAQVCLECGIARVAENAQRLHAEKVARQQQKAPARPPRGQRNTRSERVCS